MSADDFTVVIPARYASSRFPGKPLHLLNGEPMIVHVIRRARESAANSIVVATDDQRIADVCASHQCAVEMTDANHPSGTDRIAEVASRLGWDDQTIIVGLQGDEPATRASHLDLLAQNLATNTDADMATLSTPVTAIADYQNADRVKVVRNIRGMALYFSRASIPSRRDSSKGDGYPDSLIHIGIYAYRCGYLKQFSTLAAAEYEIEEQLEQLRVLHHGGRIHVDIVDAANAYGVDRPQDVAAVEAELSEHFQN